MVGRLGQLAAIILRTTAFMYSDFCRGFPARLISSVLVVLAMYAWAGCSRGGRSSTSIDSSTFDSASAAIRQSWTDAQNAAKRLEYVSAVTNLMELNLHHELTPGQSAAV